MCAITMHTSQSMKHAVCLPYWSWNKIRVNTLELLSGGDMLVRALADEGVEHIFGYPGGAVLHI